MRITYFLILFLIINSAAQAQRGNPSGNTRPTGTQQGGDQKDRLQILAEIEAEKDTFGIFYFHEDNPTKIYAVEDTSLHDFHRFDPATQPLFAHANLGIIGSAARPIFYESRFRQGFDVGYHQYDLYYLQPEKLRFHILEKPVTRIRAMQAGRQEDRAFEIEFGRNFAKGWRLNLESKSIQQLSSWKYPHQKLENRAVAGSLWYNAPSGRYDSFLSFTSNTTEAEENGGITSTPEIGLALSSPADADIALRGTAQTRHAHRILDYTHYFNFQKQDSTTRNKRAFTLSHNFQYRTSTYKFFDDSDNSSSALDSAYYQNLLVDERGVRHFLKHQAICNTFKLGTYKINEATANQIANQRDRIEVGLIHRVHFLDQEERDSLNQNVKNSAINNLFVTGQINFRPNPKLAINAYAHYALLDGYGIGTDFGDYRISGDLFFDIGKIGQLSAKVSNQLYQPSLVQQQFVVTQQKVWGAENNFGKTNETNFSATYSIPSLRLSITGSYHSLDNYIYFDTLALPQQRDSVINIGQLAVKHHLKIWNIHLVNTLAWQPNGGDVLRLPEWITRHSLYGQGKVFKNNLTFQLGVDLNMNANFGTDAGEPYFADTYNPLVGQFQLQDDAPTPFYPALDAFLNVKIKTARIFVKAQNITHSLADKYYYNYYQTSAYPQLPFFMNFGVDWTLRN